MQKDDLAGKVFGRLRVIAYAGTHRSESGKTVCSQWLCECSCKDKTRVIVTRKMLMGGVKRSCGCLRKETTAAKNVANRKVNRYDISGEYGIGYTSNGDAFYFDLDDYEKIRGFCWGYDSHGYVFSNERVGNCRRTVKLHILVMEPVPEGMIVDHIIHPETANGKKMDNRKGNLRYVTKSQNAQNQIPIRANNTSGHKGVSWNNGCWKASISVSGKRHTKYFKKDQFNNACDWYDRMADELHGEYKFKNQEE